MRGEIQGENECILATIADLTKTPLHAVRSTALAYTQQPTWALVCKTSCGEIDSPFWQAVFYVCDVFDTTKKLAHALVLASSNDADLSVCCLATNLPPKIENFPLKGKGVIVLMRRDHRGLGHIVPWEDGFAYDSNLPAIPENLPSLKMKWHTKGYFIQKMAQMC